MEIFGIPTQVLFGQLLIGLINGSFYALLSLGLAVIFGLPAVGDGHAAHRDHDRDEHTNRDPDAVAHTIADAHCAAGCPERVPGRRLEPRRAAAGAGRPGAGASGWVLPGGVPMGWEPLAALPAGDTGLREQSLDT